MKPVILKTVDDVRAFRNDMRQKAIQCAKDLMAIRPEDGPIEKAFEPILGLLDARERELEEIYKTWETKDATSETSP